MPPNTRNEGVVYTPPYVARYMVRRSLERLAEDRSSSTPGEIKILDPACGSGVFLLAAARALLDASSADGGLNFDEKCRIIKSGIHGVDTDRHAVRTARADLQALLLEDEDDPAARTLPGLRHNVICGDVLREDTAAPGWPSGGFDLVIGNPPYRRELGSGNLVRDVRRTRVGQAFQAPRMDLWYTFVHRAVELLRVDGILSFIVNAYFLSATGATNLVHTFSTELDMEEIVYLGKLRVFPGIDGRHLIFRAWRRSPTGATLIYHVGDGATGDAAPFIRGERPAAVYRKSQAALFHDGRIDIQPPGVDLPGLLAGHDPLGSLGQIRQGIAENPAQINRKTREAFGNRWAVDDGVFSLSHDELQALNLPERERALVVPYTDTVDVGRYRIAAPPSRWLIYSTKQTCPDMEAYPSLLAHLEPFREIMEQRRETKKGANRWWHLHWPRDPALWETDERILCVQMARRPSFALACGPTYVPFSINVFHKSDDVHEKLAYILAILNSRLIWKWLQHFAKRRGVGLEINGNVLREIPIRRIDGSLPGEVEIHDQLARLARTAEPPEARIDALVYELYGLNEETIREVEAATQG